MIDFNDSEESFRSKSTISILRALLVFKVSRWPFIVRHADTMLKISYSSLGETATNAILKYSFYGHFCAGEDISEVKRTIDYLERNGIGSIMDYAAESDLQEAEKERGPREFDTPSNLSSSRTYSYLDETLCDERAAIFEKCIRAVHKVSPTGFAAIKITALGNPKLLERMSAAIIEIRKLFEKFDKSGDGYVSKENFLRGYAEYFTGGEEEALKAFQLADTEADNRLDVAEWSSALVLDNLGAVVQLCKNKGPLSAAVLDEEEMELVRKMLARANRLSKIAHSLGVRLMIDAEHTYFQPAIDHVTHKLAKRFNKEAPIIFNTYQLYLTDSHDRVHTDMLKAQREGYHFACKVVRGAYMTLERERAREKGYQDPILPSLEATHHNYDGTVAHLLRSIGRGENVEVMLATHNQGSIEKALLEIEAMERSGGVGAKSARRKVYFGQLLGMADHLTFNLGNRRFNSYKYVPYGRVDEVLPYLIRRAQENGDLLGGSSHESSLLFAELRRRLNPFR